MSELIINSIWIIDIKNSLQIFMSCFFSPVVEEYTSNYNFSGPSFESQVEELFFFWEGYFCSSKCLGPAVANFELMIHSFMMNRINEMANQPFWLDLDVLVIILCINRMIMRGWLEAVYIR